MTEEELHPWKWFAPANSSVLIAGTFPPTKRNWSFDFFYPNKANLFWRVMANIAGVELEHLSGDAAVEERKRILTKLKVAITDMAHKISRTNNSSLDENISALEYMDIYTILDENPSIKKIILTSGGASKWFSAFLKDKNILHKFPKGQRPIRSEFIYKNRIIQLVILYSTSPRAANRITMEKLVELYKTELIY